MRKFSDSPKVIYKNNEEFRTKILCILVFRYVYSYVRNKTSDPSARDRNSTSSGLLNGKVQAFEHGYIPGTQMTSGRLVSKCGLCWPWVHCHVGLCADSGQTSPAPGRRPSAENSSQRTGHYSQVEGPVIPWALHVSLKPTTACQQMSTLTTVFICSPSTTQQKYQTQHKIRLVIITIVQAK